MIMLRVYFATVAGFGWSIMSNMNVQGAVASDKASSTSLALEDLLHQLQKAEAENDIGKMQDLALKMMAQIGTSEKDVQALLQKPSQETSKNLPGAEDIQALMGRIQKGDTTAVGELEKRIDHVLNDAQVLNEAHTGTDFGAEGSRFMGTTRRVDAQQLQLEQKPVEGVSRSSGVSFDTLLSNTPVNAISQSAVSEDAPSGGVRGAKAQDAASTTLDELSAAGILGGEIKYDKDGLPIRPTAGFDDESMLLSVNTILEKPDTKIPTEAYLRNGDIPLSSQLESTASNMESDISDLSSSINSMSKDIAAEGKYIAEADATIAKLDQEIAKLKLESEVMITFGSTLLAAGTILLSISIGLKVAGAVNTAMGLAAMPIPPAPMVLAAGVAFTAKGIALMIMATAMIAGGIALIVIGKQKKDEYEAKEKTRDEVKEKKAKAEKRKELLEKKVKEAKDKKVAMEKQKAQAEAAQQSAQTNETAAGPALDKANDEYSEAKNAIDQLKQAIPNPTPAQKETINALTRMVVDLDKKLDAMYTPVNKGQPLSKAQTDAFESAMKTFTNKINAEYAKLNSQAIS